MRSTREEPWTEERFALGRLDNPCRCPSIAGNLPDALRQRVQDRIVVPPGDVTGKSSGDYPEGRAARNLNPLELIVLLVSPPNRTAEHIQALGKISRLLADSKVRRAAYTAPSAEALYALFKNAEAVVKRA